jgi:hypothetical protein
MPDEEASTEHVYVAVFEFPTGPVTPLHETPETPAIVQVAVPVGVAPEAGPATEAVKVNVDPMVVVGELVVTEIVGLNFETFNKYGLLGPTLV